MDLDEMFERRDIKNSNTKDTYRHTFTKAFEMFGDTHPFNRSEKLINRVLEQSDAPTYLKYSILVLGVMLRSDDGRPTASLVANQNRLKKELEIERQEKLEKLELPDYTGYFDKVDKLTECDPQKYIVNKLFQKFAFRNQDMNLNLIKLRRGQRAPTEKNNTLVIKQRKIDLRIADYKTITSYGIKSLVIDKKENPKLYKTINDYYESGQRFLLSKKDMTRIAHKSLHSHIRKLTNGVGSGNLFKMSVRHCLANGDLNRINELGRSRGTSMQTIVASYNAQTKSPPPVENEEMIN